MTKHNLTKTDKTAIRRLNTADVEATMASLKPFLKRSKWIGSKNYYNKNVIHRLKREIPNSPEKSRDLAQYIAASTALHTIDGWSYLGRAISCILAGDSHRALHLGYYAELRAAMSLLASAGIGIFDRKHFAICAPNEVKKLATALPTHRMAWLTLTEWARQPRSGELFSKLIRPEGITLEDWFRPHGGASSLMPRAKSWFMQWGMDLGLASKDHDARNTSSYRPDGVPTTWEIGSRVGVAFVQDIWRLLEPSSGSSFEQVDLHILRLAVEGQYCSRFGRKASNSSPAFVRFVEGIIAAQGLASTREQRLRSFLLREATPADPLVFDYSSKRPKNPGHDAFAVIARAVLLLRVATGAANISLQRVGLNAATLSFWWQKLGEARGLWAPGSPPFALTDLWADVEDSLHDVDDIAASSPDTLNSFHSLSHGLSMNFSVLASHERVGLWGLCPP